MCRFTDVNHGGAMDRLTEKQAKIMDYIREHVLEQGYPPTMREMGQHFGFTWAAAKGHLRALERKGYIRITPNTSRGIEVLDLHTAREPEPETLALPLVGDIRAGAPILALEDISERVSVDRNIFRDPGAFVLRVRGESMREAGILDGDYAIVRPQQTIESGGIGVALIGEEATVKRILRSGDMVTLKPENHEMSPVTYPASEVKIIGVVSGIIRKM